jgi:hypothetical protein
MRASEARDRLSALAEVTFMEPGLTDAGREAGAKLHRAVAEWLERGPDDARAPLEAALHETEQAIPVLALGDAGYHSSLVALARRLRDEDWVDDV